MLSVLLLAIGWLTPTASVADCVSSKNIDVIATASESSQETGGIVFLEKNNGVLTQQMFADMKGKSRTNTVFAIQYDYTLQEDIVMPEGSVLYFDGGSLGGGHKVTGNNTGIMAQKARIFNTNVILSGTWKVSEVYPEWFGAKGNGVTDDTYSLEACFNFAASQSVPSKLSAKTYIVQPNKTVTWNIPPDKPIYELHAAFLMKSNMKVVGEDQTVLKFKDNYVTPKKQNRFFLFFTNDVLHDVSFIKVTFDMNGAKNRFNTKTSTFLTFQQAVIGVSSEYNGKRDAKIDNVLIERCRFLNNAGVTCIAMGVTNNRIPVKDKGRHWVISNCLFKNNGLDCDDHSTIFAYADDVLCINNVFTADKPFPNGLYPKNSRNGALCAYEIHGDNQTFANNIVENYGQGLWITPHTDTLRNAIIKGNKFYNMFRFGMRVFAEKTFSIVNVLITDNEFELVGNVKGFGLTSSIALSFQCENGKCCDFDIRNNEIKYLHTNSLESNIGVSLSKNHYGINIDSNVMEGCSSCVYIASDGQMEHLKITNNSFKNLYSNVTSTSKAIYFVVKDGTTEDMYVSGNEYKNDKGKIDTGVYLRGTFKNVKIDEDTPNGVKTHIVSDRAVVNGAVRNGVVNGL